MSMDILSKIPHRPPFLFLDEVESVSDTGIVARRKIRAEEPQFQGHYPGNPIMPGVLLCESVFQAGAVYLVANSPEGEASERTPVLARIKDAKFKKMVKPGDEITIEATFFETVSQFHFMKGRVLNAEGKPALTIEFALALIDEKGQG